MLAWGRGRWAVSQKPKLIRLFFNFSLQKSLKSQMNQKFDIFYLSSIPWNMFNMNRINILWSFSSIEASISEIFAIKNCYFLTLIFVELSEKLLVKTACDVNVGQVKKSRKFKTVFFESIWRRNWGGLLERTSNLSSKVASCGYNFII